MQNAKLKIEYGNINDFTPYKNNTRKHADKDIEAIKASIEKFGFNDAIAVWGEQMLVVEGHGRIQAANNMGLSMDVAAKKIVEEARKTTKDSGVKIMARKISGYATKNNKEAIAEAYADVYCNGNKATAQSKAIMQTPEKYL